MPDGVAKCMQYHPWNNYPATIYPSNKSIRFGLVYFYDILAIVSHLMPNPVDTYVSNTYDLLTNC